MKQTTPRFVTEPVVTSLTCDQCERDILALSPIRYFTVETNDFEGNEQHLDFCSDACMFENRDAYQVKRAGRPEHYRIKYVDLAAKPEELTLDEKIAQHAALKKQIEALEDQAYLLGQDILTATDAYTPEQLNAIYPNVADSSVKYELFLRIKHGNTEGAKPDA